MNSWDIFDYDWPWGKHPAVIISNRVRVQLKQHARITLPALPNAKLQIVKACGHCVDMEQPEALAKLVTDFIAQG
jgi:pimeloyl-ACP methyl ester carboxylesterase